jgi:hypothetical protein
MDENVQVARAREHIAEGEKLLRRASLPGGTDAEDARLATMATAHFTASMAITNLLLADPAEAPDVVER